MKKTSLLAKKNNFNLIFAKKVKIFVDFENSFLDLKSRNHKMNLTIEKLAEIYFAPP